MSLEYNLFLIFVLLIELMGGYVIIKAVMLQNQREKKPMLNGRLVLALLVICIIMMGTLFIRIYLF